MEAYSITDDQGNPSKAPDALVTAITCASSMSVERLKELIELHSEEVTTTPPPLYLLVLPHPPLTAFRIIMFLFYSLSFADTSSVCLPLLPLLSWLLPLLLWLF